MNEKTSKLIQWVLYILLGLSAILGILFYTDTVGNTNLLIYWGYLLGIIVIATTVGTLLWNLLRNPKGSIKFLIALAAIIVIFIIGYSVTPNSYTTAQLEKLDITPATAKMVGAGLLILYLMSIGAVVTIIYTSVAKFFK
jgi:hypothetical protein